MVLVGTGVPLRLYLAFFSFLNSALAFFELSLESRVSMEACDGDSSCDTSGIDIALEMVTADDAAFAHLISAFEDFVLALRVDFRQEPALSPSRWMCGLKDMIRW